MDRKKKIGLLRRGQPKKLPVEREPFIVEMVETNPKLSAANLASDLLDRFGNEVTVCSNVRKA